MRQLKRVSGDAGKQGGGKAAKLQDFSELRGDGGEPLAWADGCG